MICSVPSGRPAAAPPLHDAMAEDRAHRAVDVANRQPQSGRRLALDRLLNLLQNPPVEMVLVNVALRPHASQRTAVRCVGHGEHSGKIQPLGLPVIDGAAALQPIDAADHVVELAEAQLRHQLPHLFRHKAQVSHQVFRLAGKPFPQLLLLRGDAHRAGAEVALPHQQATQRHQCRSAEAETFGPQQGADHHVATGLHLTVHLDDDPITQAVEHEGLLRFRQSELPGRAGVLDGAQGAGAGAAVMAADEDFVGIAFGHARRHRAHAHLGNQLHRDDRAGLAHFRS